MAYLGKLEIDNNGEVVIGSMLYGICNSDADAENKNVVMPAFDSLETGITIHVRFINANTNDESIALRVNNTSAKTILNPGGKLTWSPNSVISFTYDADCEDGYGAWIMNNSGNVTISAEDVFNAIGDLKAMTFQGTVGANGTIRYLPLSPSAGDTYKVTPSYTVPASSSATGSALSAKEGDLLIAVLQANAVKWVLIPSGNDTDLFIAKGENNTNKFLQGNDSWVDLQTNSIAEIVDGELRINAQVLVGAAP